MAQSRPLESLILLKKESTKKPSELVYVRPLLVRFRSNCEANLGLIFSKPCLFLMISATSHMNSGSIS